MTKNRGGFATETVLTNVQDGGHQFSRVFKHIYCPWQQQQVGFIKLSDLPHVLSLWTVNNEIKTTLNVGFQKMKIQCLKSRRDEASELTFEAVLKTACIPLLTAIESELHTLEETLEIRLIQQLKNMLCVRL